MRCDVRRGNKNKPVHLLCAASAKAFEARKPDPQSKLLLQHLLGSPYHPS
jgi:hypothetical protein